MACAPSAAIVGAAIAPEIPAADLVCNDHRGRCRINGIIRPGRGPTPAFRDGATAPRRACKQGALLSCARMREDWATRLKSQFFEASPATDRVFPVQVGAWPAAREAGSITSMRRNPYEQRKSVP